ncbi:hypothetical protein ACJ72_08143 [Emergomyces africanus]|uniref:Uncharacterized protein n=1 Tax=Emergomyces africanus TaxID=1955775 RepID=A0A1B7NLP9_9EURO|nr:hypothetical protein ACJ72_08143 [Emergomyces africanus]
MSNQEILKFSDNETDSDINDCESKSFTEHRADVSSDKLQSHFISICNTIPTINVILIVSIRIAWPC